MAQISDRRRRTSGAMCGEQLARAGHKVNLFDDTWHGKNPARRPDHKAIQCFPFLLDNSYPKKLVNSVELISSEEQHATLDMPHPIVIYSRTVLNGMLLRSRARCRLQRAAFPGDECGPTSTSNRATVWKAIGRADFLVLAAVLAIKLLPDTGIAT